VRKKIGGSHEAKTVGRIDSLFGSCNRNFLGAISRSGWRQSRRGSKKQVLQAEDDEGKAILKGDTKTLDRLWADELLYTNQKGELHTKAEHLAEFQSGARKFDSYKHDDIRVHVYPDMVVVNGRSTSTAHDKGETSIGPRRYTNVWVKQDGQWRLVVHHVTDIVKPGSRPLSDPTPK
jgi:ketosteroid isomerase-like protein